MRRLHSKKKMLTRDKEKFNQYRRQKVSAISFVIPRSLQCHSSGIQKWKGYIREQGHLGTGVRSDNLRDFSFVATNCVTSVELLSFALH